MEKIVSNGVKFPKSIKPILFSFNFSFHSILLILYKITPPGTESIIEGVRFINNAFKLSSI